MSRESVLIFSWESDLTSRFRLFGSRILYFHSCWYNCYRMTTRRSPGWLNWYCSRTPPAQTAAHEASTVRDVGASVCGCARIVACARASSPALNACWSSSVYSKCGFARQSIIRRAHDVSGLGNEPVVEVHNPSKLLEPFDGCRLWESVDSLHFGG